MWLSTCTFRESSVNTCPHSTDKQIASSEGLISCRTLNEPPGEQHEVPSMSCACAQHLPLAVVLRMRCTRRGLGPRTSCPRPRAPTSAWWFWLLVSHRGPGATLPFCLQLSQLTGCKSLRGSGRGLRRLQHLTPCPSRLCQELLLHASSPQPAAARLLVDAVPTEPPGLMF